MLKSLIARLFAAKNTTVRRPVNRFRPLAEVLEGREVPAGLDFQWNGGFANGFDNPLNWLGGTANYPIPRAGDNISFGQHRPTPDPDSGSPTSEPCPNLHPPIGGGSYLSIVVEADYTSVVTITDGNITTGELAMLGGAIDQNSYDLTVTGTSDSAARQQDAAFYWTAGTINNGSILCNVNITNCSTWIKPSGGTVTTGSTLNFTGTTQQPAQGTVDPGTINFNNGAGAVVGAGAAIAINLNSADVNFYGLNKPWSETDTQIELRTGATVVVTGPGNWNVKKKQLLNNGGTPIVQGTASVDVDMYAPLPAPDPPDRVSSIIQNSGKTYLCGGCQVRGSGGTEMVNGELIITYVGPSLSSEDDPTTATINGDLIVRGGKVYYSDRTPIFNDPNQGYDYMTFLVTGDVYWKGGTYRPLVDMRAPGLGDLWHIKDNLVLPANYVAGEPYIDPIYVNAPEALPPGYSVDLVQADNGVLGVCGVVPHPLTKAQLGIVAIWLVNQ